MEDRISEKNLHYLPKEAANVPIYICMYFFLLFPVANLFSCLLGVQ